MKKLIGILCFAIAMCSPALAADTKKEPSEKQKAQQQRMTDCNAKAKGMKGDERKTFMSSCLKGEDVAKKPTTQQDKMTACNKEASAKSLKGDQRKSFMSTCLKG